MLSIEDNQIIKLSARSPYNLMSGCRIVRKSDPTPDTTPANDAVTTEPSGSWTSEEGSATVTDAPNFDKFLKTTTAEAVPIKRNSENDLDSTDQSRPSEIEDFYSTTNLTDYNETEVFNATGDNGPHNGGGLQFKHDVMPFENNLENSTEYRSDVEEMFQKLDSRRPIRQAGATSPRSEQIGPILRRKKRETLQVRCHNAGTFFSARERWWYIAVSNCGGDKGLDITYRFKMTNGQPGDFWSEHYSADEMRTYLYPLGT